MAAAGASLTQRVAEGSAGADGAMGEKALPLVYKRYICSYADCNAAYNKNWKLQAHMCKHTGAKPFHCKAEGCDKEFTRLYHLTRHSLSHSGEKNVKCESEGCDLKFCTKEIMKKHFNRFHSPSSCIYVCHFENCGKMFKKHNQLKVHQFTHTQQLPYKCTHEGCDMRFNVPSRLKRHEKVHAGYPCKKDDTCLFVGKTWTLYLKHVAECHQEPLVCDVCKRKFKHKDILKDHKKIHERERTVYRCPRDGCDRTYTTAFNLQNHVLVFHEEQKPFACEHAGCGKTFAMKVSTKLYASC
ncbi:hypothetical protein XENTR_v10006978 [Xenopus tropicalis]|nr:hypothetical protein XENTR_v10006978 [Xenopus tropicalis]